MFKCWFRSVALHKFLFGTCWPIFTQRPMNDLKIELSMKFLITRSSSNCIENFISHKKKTCSHWLVSDLSLPDLFDSQTKSVTVSIARVAALFLQARLLLPAATASECLWLGHPVFVLTCLISPSWAKSRPQEFGDWFCSQKTQNLWLSSGIMIALRKTKGKWRDTYELKWRKAVDFGLHFGTCPNANHQQIGTVLLIGSKCQMKAEARTWTQAQTWILQPHLQVVKVYLLQIPLGVWILLGLLRSLSS